MKVALLNPPSRQRIIRDYYCSKTSKSTYLFAPADLLMQSGILGRDNELIVMDAVAQGLGTQTCLQRLKAYMPQAALGLVSAVRLKQDLDFYIALKDRVPTCLIFLSGEPVLENPEQWLRQNPFVDGILLRFVSRGLAQYLAGEKEIEGLVLKSGGEIKTFPQSRAPEYSVGRTRQELFQFPKYFFPFAKRRRFATFLTDFGCPFKCGFCVMAELGYRKRNLAEIEEELDFLSWLGIKELFLADQSFGAAEEHSWKVMRLFEKYRNSFTAFVRPDQRDGEFWKELERSGCHTVIVGLESASDEILKAYDKGYSRQEIEEGIRRAKEAGLRVVATVIIGLPEDSAETINETMKFVRRLQPDFVSYNLAVPRSLTGLKQKVMAEGLGTRPEMDQAGSFAAVRTRSLAEEQLLKLKQKAVRDFYFRSTYLWNRYRKAHGAFELYALMREGLAVLSKNI